MKNTGPTRIASPSGLAVEVNANGSVARMLHADVIVNAFLGNEVEGGPANVFLRRRGPAIDWTPLLGPRSPGTVHVDPSGLVVAGEWLDVRFRLGLRLAASATAWIWHLSLENAGGTAVTLDAVCAQDLSLADYSLTRINEYYVSQYVDHAPLRHPQHGTVLAARQNLPIGTRHPWLLLGSLRRATSFCTDALQLHGLATRAGATPAGLAAESLPGVRRQHEHAMAVLQDAPVTLVPGELAHLGFFGWFEPDHPDASSERDLAVVARAMALPEAEASDSRPEGPPSDRGAVVHATRFSHAPLLACHDLDDAALRALVGGERRAVERSDGRVVSFFTGTATHVITAEKERATVRAHAQILRTGTALVPDEASLTTTVWMNGVFNSMLTQGHVSINRLLSTTHGYLGLFRSHGQRVFVEVGDEWRLLDEPSACAMTPSGARWLYRHANGMIEVETWAAVDRHEVWLAVRVLEGAHCRFLVSHHLALAGDDGARPMPIDWSRDAHGVVVHVPPASDLGRRFPQGTFRIDFAEPAAFRDVGGDELLFLDGVGRGLPFVVLRSAPVRELALRITGQLVQPAPQVIGADAKAMSARDAAAADRFWHEMTGALAMDAGGPACHEALTHLGCILPWFAHDALIHYLAPRGLEQYTGGGWGSRDVCQGPVELLLALGRYEPVRDLLVRVFSQQNPDGDWPQWFTFFARERSMRGPDSHGDIVFWPLLALAEYLAASDDFDLLDARLPWFHSEGDSRAEHGTMLDHVQRALALIESRAIPGTSLTAYGHGDWNDTLQPVDPQLAAELCSAWTVTLHHQSFAALAFVLRRGGGRDALAARLEATVVRIRDDFQRLLLVDDVLAGFARFPAGGTPEPWLHPRDTVTGLRYSVLAMIHAVLAEIFTLEQAERHMHLIDEHLRGTDGVRLFDRPIPYRGGPESRFRRAESSPFFGREVGLMYMHAHLRYIEALARMGRADAFFLALRQANPVGLGDVVPNARFRQANCYTSSSDADFADRYAASAHYDAVRSGDVSVEGGWRVYSSGPGITVRLVRECLLGLRLRRAFLGIDPVMPTALDGTQVRTVIAEHEVSVRYAIGPRGCDPQRLTLNGASLPFTRERNPYREGGATVALNALRAGLRDGPNELVVEIA